MTHAPCDGLDGPEDLGYDEARERLARAAGDLRGPGLPLAGALALAEEAGRLADRCRDLLRRTDGEPAGIGSGAEPVAVPQHRIVEGLWEEIRGAVLEPRERELELERLKLRLLAPAATLARGYASVERREEEPDRGFMPGAVARSPVRRYKDATPGTLLWITVAGFDFAAMSSGQYLSRELALLVEEHRDRLQLAAPGPHPRFRFSPPTTPETGEQL